jgi:hypothetical protein
VRDFLRRLFAPRSLLGACFTGLLWWLWGDAGESDYILAIDPLTLGTILAVAGTAGGLGTQLALGGGDADFDLARQPVSGFVPGSDPILAALQRQQLLQSGQDPGQLAGQGSPVLQFLNVPLSGALGPFTGDFNTTVFSNAATAVSDEVSKGLAAGTDEATILENINRRMPVGFQGFQQNAAVAAGFSNFEDMVRAQINFERERPEEAARARELLPTIRAGQDAATRGISQILQDFPLPTQANINELAGTFAGDFRRDRLQQANVGGFPADLRNIEREGLLQALGVFGGQQQLAGGALSAFRGDQTLALQNALATQAQGQAAQLGAAGLAGAQASAFADLANRTELANLAADQDQANQLTNLFGTLAGGGFELGAAKLKGPAAEKDR